MKTTEPNPGSDWIIGGGEMGALIRSMDWSQTPLGSIDSWTQSLRTTVNLCLASDLPICIIWGPELVQLYNDGYRVICGDKHPHSMGQNFKECWNEAWPVIGAAHDSALAGDTAFLENQHIFLKRYGYVEETFFTFSFSPVRDETGRLTGLFHPVIETTPGMLADRRTRTLRDLASRTIKAKSPKEAYMLTTETLAEYPLDLPFLLIYQIHKMEEPASLVTATGLAAGAKGAPVAVALDEPDDVNWPLAQVVSSGKTISVDDVASRFATLTGAAFPEPVTSAVLLPITPPGALRPVAVVVAGISPRLTSSEMYGGFHDQLGSTVTTAVANALAYEEERKRAEALAEIDRAKTAFFSNVSHEFRTPLTLMLGPTEELLALPPGHLSADALTQLDVIRRNSLRLQRLVNSLLDFSRLEAGRIEASYEPVDLATLSGDLASVFQSAVEKAGLKFIVDCPPLPEPVYVDRDMWEKIVLNLVSNAFKFTLAGEIEVTQRDTGGSVQLSVRDTGTGISAAELRRVFERFHRVQGAASRTHEGTGIGLALVQELVKFHGGTVGVESILGKGSVFTVTIPTGTDHLPQDRLGMPSTLQSTAAGAMAFLEESLRWLPDEESARITDLRPGIPPRNGSASGDPARTDAPVGRAPGVAGETTARPRILLADDNADMRDYLRRLLGPQFHVETTPDGQAALELIRQQLPDLVITDVMMPRLDGFSLVQQLRADASTRHLPIIMLSARAGEESRVEGLDAGADDYLIKPFSARELLARVESQLKLAAMRREAGQQIRVINEKLEQRVLELQESRRVALNLAEDAVQAEESLQKAKTELETKVIERTAELAQTYEDLKTENAERLSGEKDRVRLLNQLVTVQEDERRRIARDLHDELGQQLTALRLKLENAKDICEDEAVCDEIGDIQVIAKRLDTDVSFLARELRPAALNEKGLPAALSAYVTEWSNFSTIAAECHTTGLTRKHLNPETEVNLYRIAQEALNNVQKHSKARTASVLLEKRKGEITLIIEDDGTGFNPSRKSKKRRGLGLIGMHERAALIGGTIEVESSRGNGTTIFVRIPIVPKVKEISNAKSS